MSTIQKSNLLFDPSLTPQNAKEKGYKYIDDVIYDLINPNEAMGDIVAFLREFNGKLGSPLGTVTDSSYFGLYLPN